MGAIQKIVAETVQQDDESAPDQKRIVTRLATRFFLQGLGLARALGGGDILDGLIMLAITDANTRHLNATGVGFQAHGDVPPDEARRPVSVYLVARELGLSYETARRHVQSLIRRGMVERLSDGIVVPARIFEDAAVMELTRKNYVNVRKFIANLRDINAL